MKRIEPYLIFNGNCMEAFLFYKSVFGGEFSSLMKFGEMPEKTFVVAEEDQEKILHISFPVGSMTLMGSDVGKQAAPDLIQGNTINLSYSSESEEDARTVFNRLAQEGKVILDLRETFWATLYGMCIDKFGINWLVNYGYKE